MSETAFCYHCGAHHPNEEMRQILTKSGKRWRCIKSIEATKVGASKRYAFGKRIEIRGFGSFGINYRPARTGRNPKTGVKVLVPEKCVPHFNAGKELKARVDS